ncbi:MAG: CcoQ/FixQ family Cbb3-type cytochrome c oxidase assembly chaperone [Flavobacteriales bacterium]|nr:CcoQ/FixQ family Cbb3-type cytochrome c oxidase assembly chaperone [Flavobacteriales bacterium]
MLKYIANHLNSINGIALWPTISFVFFFAFFLVMVWWVLTTPKKDLEHIAHVPLNDEEGQPINTLKDRS